MILSDNPPAGTPIDPNHRSKRRSFQKSQGPRLPPDGVERQSRVTLHAWNMLGPDGAIAFLNSFDDGLGGRPLDLAVASEAGLQAVQRAISTRTAPE